MRPLHFIFIFVASLSLLLSSCETTDCTEMGCEDSPTRLKATLPQAIADLDGGKVTACRSSGCVSSDSLRADNGQATLSFPLSATTGTITSTAEGSRLEVVLPVVIDRFSVPAQETFRLQVTDSKGTMLLDRQVTSESRWYPNGKDCDGDYFCTGGSVQL